MLLFGEEQSPSLCPSHPICLYVDGDNCLGDVYHLVHAESDAGETDDALEFPIFPKDSVVFFGGVLRSGLYAAVRGE